MIPAISNSDSSSPNTRWQQRSANAVWPPCTKTSRLDSAPPLPIAKGQGVWLSDYAGQRYLDATSSWWVNLFGHAHPAINAALGRQLDTMSHVMLAGCTHAPAIELAERLRALTADTLTRTFFASDGASAVEIALKMSFHFWRNSGYEHKREFVCLSNGYHGETLGALGVTDIATFRRAYAPLLTSRHTLPSPDSRLAAHGETGPDATRHALNALEALLARRGEHIAALIIEPLVQCAGGMAMHPPLYVQEARRLCTQYQVHLIADEIAVGCGRTGTFFACEQANVWPDILTISKGISAGYLPLALTLTREEIYQAFVDDDVDKSFLHSHSYSGNALACTAALAMLDLFDAQNVLHENRTRSNTIWRQLENGLAPFKDAGLVMHPRCQGMIFAFDVGPSTVDARFAERFHLGARQHGLLIRPIGNTVYLMPPYVINDAEIEHMVRGTLATLADTLNLRGNCHAPA